MSEDELREELRLHMENLKQVHTREHLHTVKKRIADTRNKLRDAKKKVK